uniref:Solute-binding protein family 3/N-terminal domain-containing protein n=1 Tax=Alexandrium monilatum TaxID=311494 RepID=A0A7S4QR94_9DINO
MRVSLSPRGPRLLVHRRSRRLSSPLSQGSWPPAAPCAPASTWQTACCTRAGTKPVHQQSRLASALTGIAPDMAAELARRFGLELCLVPFDAPGKLADAVDAWDIGLIGADPQRAEKITFTPAYAEIPVTYLVRPGSAISSIADVDRPGVRVASVANAAFDLWLQRNLKHAKLLGEASSDAGLELVKSGKADVLAGIKEMLDAYAARVEGSRVLDGSIMTVQQAIGIPKSRSCQLPLLVSALEELKSSGFVAGLLEKHGRIGKLQVAPCAAAAPCESGVAAAPAAQGGMKIAVLGCGAMGSIYAGLLASSGKNEVWAVDVWREHVAAMRKSGLRVQGASGDRTVRVHATTEAGDVGPVDLVIIATKASGVAAAAQAATGLLKEDGVVITIQNGLGSGERIAQHIDPKRVMLGIASNFGASMKGPGHAEHKSMNLICMGEMVGGSTERLNRVVQVWEEAGFNVKGEADIHQMIWDKFICNCTYSGSCTITGMTVGEVQDCPAAWAVALACAREAFEVAGARDIKLAFDDVEERVRRFGSTVRGAQPSMLQDHLAKRRSEVDAINGAVPVEAAKVGLQAPVNQTVADLVRARESTF